MLCRISCINLIWSTLHYFPSCLCAKTPDYINRLPYPYFWLDFSIGNTKRRLQSGKGFIISFPSQQDYYKWLHLSVNSLLWLWFPLVTTCFSSPFILSVLTVSAVTNPGISQAVAISLH